MRFEIEIVTQEEYNGETQSVLTYYEVNPVRTSCWFDNKPPGHARKCGDLNSYNELKPQLAQACVCVCVCKLGQVQLDKDTLASPMLPPSVSVSLCESL